MEQFLTMYWQQAPRPQIRTASPGYALRAERLALKMIDLDIQQFGEVTVETIEYMRAVLERLKRQPAAV